MLGTLLGIGGLIFFIANSLESKWDVTGSHLAYTGLLMAGGLLVAGLVFRMTVGIALMWLVAGALIGSVISFFKGEPATGFPLLLTAAAFAVVLVTLSALSSRRAIKTGQRVAERVSEAE